MRTIIGSLLLAALAIGAVSAGLKISTFLSGDATQVDCKTSKEIGDILRDKIFIMNFEERVLTIDDKKYIVHNDRWCLSP